STLCLRLLSSLRPRPPRSPLFPYTTLFRSVPLVGATPVVVGLVTVRVGLVVVGVMVARLGGTLSSCKVVNLTTFGQFVPNCGGLWVSHKYRVVTIFRHERFAIGGIVFHRCSLLSLSVVSSVGPERFEISAPSVKLPTLSALVIGSSRDTLQVAHELRNLHTSAARVPWHMVTLRPHPTLTPPPNTELAALRVHATSPPLHELGALHGGLSC